MVQLIRSLTQELRARGMPSSCAWQHKALAQSLALQNNSTSLKLTLGSWAISSSRTPQAVLDSCLRDSIPAQTSWPRSSWGGKGLFSLHFHIAVHHWKKSGLELKQVREQELMQRPWKDVLYWLAPLGLLSRLSSRTKTTSPEMVPPTRGPPPLITNWENALQLDLIEAFPQLKLLSLW